MVQCATLRGKQQLTLSYNTLRAAHYTNHIRTKYVTTFVPLHNLDLKHDILYLEPSTILMRLCKEYIVTMCAWKAYSKYYSYTVRNLDWTWCALHAAHCKRGNSAPNPALGGFSPPPHMSREFPVWPALTQAHKHNRTLAYLHTPGKHLFNIHQQLFVWPEKLQDKNLSWTFSCKKTYTMLWPVQAKAPSRKLKSWQESGFLLISFLSYWVCLSAGQRKIELNLMLIYSLIQNNECYSFLIKILYTNLFVTKMLCWI